MLHVSMNNAFSIIFKLLIVGYYYEDICDITLSILPYKIQNASRYFKIRLN